MNDWRAQGACKDQPAHIFFPDTGEMDWRAAALCSHCPVLLDCRTWGLHHEDDGIWGGISENERRIIRRRQGIRLRTVTAADSTWRQQRAAYLWRQGWKINDIAIELRTYTEQIHRWLNAEGLDAHPPPRWTPAETAA